MTPPGPNFSPFPFDQLRRLSRREAALESALARWLAVHPLGEKIAALAGGAVRARLVGVREQPGAALQPDPHAALAEVRVGEASIMVAASSWPVRVLAQRLLGGPAELAAPRPLTVVEHAIWALAVAAASVDLDLAAEVWPLASAWDDGEARGQVTAAFLLELPPGFGPAPMTVTAQLPGELLARLARAVPPRSPHGWRLDLPIVVGRCALSRASVHRLAVRDVITLEPRLELVLGAGVIGLSAQPGAVEARVTTEYVGRDMALPDDASVEITVQLGTTRMSLRQLGELAIGQIVPLGRPLAGPYEVRAAGRVVGQGELVDIDGELGVRIVSIADQPDQE